MPQAVASLRVAVVSALPDPATVSGLLQQGGKLWFSNGVTWVDVTGAGGATMPTGGGSNKVFYENDQTVTEDYTISTGKNAMSAGPITIADGVTVTVSEGSFWRIVGEDIPGPEGPQGDQGIQGEQGDPGVGVSIGSYVFVQTELTGAEEPPSSNFIKLTAGLTGSGQYNEGKLTSESVTGSAPLVVATAVIDDATSPMDGQTVNLINTENRYIMPGTSAGTVANDQLQNLTGTVLGGQESLTGTGVFSAGAAGSSLRPANGSASSRAANFAFSSASGARTGDHTNVKRIQVTAYMRIK